MISNDQELEVTQQRLVKMQKILAQLRVTAHPGEFEMVASGYRAELERMHRQIMEYLTSPAQQASA